jgi:hypothetical protein
VMQGVGEIKTSTQSCHRLFEGRPILDHQAGVISS